MAELTEDQRLWLKRKRLLPHHMFDATGFNTNDRRVRMKEEGLHFYFGGAPCKKEGHTLRSRAGHCIQCDPAHISYQKRSAEAAYIYLAGSPKTKFLKVGTTNDLTVRENQINRSVYGGGND